MAGCSCFAWMWEQSKQVDINAITFRPDAAGKLVAVNALSQPAATPLPSLPPLPPHCTRSAAPQAQLVWESDMNEFVAV